LDCRNRLQLAADTLLPADIIDAILDGRQPADLSPVGADSVAIIAMASNVDVAFVMAMQTTRLILVLLIGPSLASFVARRAGAVKRSP
jgi:hypothetical protein